MTTAQLDVLDRSVEKVYEGWRPDGVPLRYRDPLEFIERVRREALLPGDTSASYAVAAAASVLRRHVSAGEIEDIARLLPEPLRALVIG
jgi:uncharacterized protein (DUF2267 family)